LPENHSFLCNQKYSVIFSLFSAFNRDASALSDSIIPSVQKALEK